MEQIINTFLVNENLTHQNSLTHLLDFDDEFSDLTNTVETSRYYSSADIIQKIESNPCTIMSINCQSLNVKFSKIKLLIDTFAEYGKPIQVLCFQETWFENTNLIDMGQFHIDNYHLLTKSRYASDHGGLACYIHKNWNYTIKPTLVESPYWEEMFVEISNPDNPKSIFTIGIFYRPPHIAVAQLTSFIDYFGEKLAHFNTREKFYICGDFNINLLSLSSNEHVRNYFEGILSSGFLPIITLPT